MAIVNRICAEDSTDCRGLSLLGNASDLLDAVGINPYTDIFEIPVHSDNQVCVCFWFDGEPFELWAGLSYETKDFFTECRRWSEDANGEIVDFSMFTEDQTEEELKPITTEALKDYERKHGAEAAADLLALCPPDCFSGDYSAALEEMKRKAQRIAERKQSEVDTANENWRRCKNIADEVEVWAQGVIYKCPECGEYYNIEEAEETEDGHICPECGEEIEESEAEPAFLYDYFDDVLNIEYRIDSNGEYMSVQLMVACGGPNIYIDTASAAVELYWWGDRASAYFSRSAADNIDDIWSEYYQMTR